MKIDAQLLWLVGAVVAFLAIASGVGFILARRIRTPAAQATIQNLNARIRAWWVMVLIFGLALATGGVGSLVLFGFTSFWALREFITLTPTRPGDHRTLFWVFFVITPLQYYLLAIRWYTLVTIFIPVYAFLFIPLRSAMAGDCERFLERIAKMQWGLMICVYCVSYAPALLTLQIPGYEKQNGKLLCKHKIAPHVSPSKTVEGFLGGVLSATLIGTALWWATPFKPLAAAGMSLAITLMGFAGGLVMSAIKRDRGVKDYGALIEGHGGVMDRIDSLCFAAPVFFHLTRYFFT
jgi:phosphatidate cytidylyltransferase